MPLQLTKPAPQWKTTAVLNGEFKDIGLSDYKGKYVVLFFYPLDLLALHAPGVDQHSAQAGYVYNIFRKIGCEVIAASTDSHFTHLAWINTPRKQDRVRGDRGLHRLALHAPGVDQHSAQAGYVYNIFRKIGCEVIATSTDSHFTHLAWINTPRKQGGLGPMNIPIISDKSHRIARDYGVLNEETGIPFRGLFIIDEHQNLRQITVNDLPVGR
ncbi:Thiol peroxiredoxin [Operophtera brumata]|uniref:thioredoxin-dependent peroxiredoxin n=1 Tax=Operophtera brumata TaxID=104452 RepID=A0A0L7LCH3_OPEBR|nr:Thiol peroxiredoxin [Operophtera brumata]